MNRALALSLCLLTGCTNGYWGGVDNGALMSAAQEAARTNKPLVIEECTGGGLGATMQAISFMRKNGVRVEVRGNAESACTALIQVEKLCYAPNARFRFHGARDYPTDKPNKAASDELRQSYPPNLQKWTLNTGALDSPNRWTELTGQEIAMLDKRPRICT